MQITAGWNIDLLFFNASLQVNLATLTFPAWTIQSPPPVIHGSLAGQCLCARRQPASYSVSWSDGKTYFPVRWALFGGVRRNSISSSGVFTAASPGGRSLTVVATNSKGIVAKTVVTVGAPLDCPEPQSQHRPIGRQRDHLLDAPELHWR